MIVKLNYKDAKRLHLPLLYKFKDLCFCNAKESLNQYKSLNDSGKKSFKRQAKIAFDYELYLNSKKV